MICNVCANQTCTHHGFCHFPGCECWCGCPFRWYWWLRKHFTRWNLTKSDLLKLRNDGYSRVLYFIDDIPPIFLPELDLNSLRRFWKQHNAGEVPDAD